MRYITICLFLVFGMSLSAQEWTFKKAISLDAGARFYNSDLGIAGGFDAGLGFMIYNINEETSGLVFTTRVFFNNFSKEDEFSEAKREFLGFSGGFGLHVQQKVFGSVKVGYLKLLNTSSISDELMATGSFFGGAELTAELANFA
ncbi:MAG: hypothetical protein AAGD05_09040, partial [Bacteroidota bacterium]